jgi:large subunit ribosomal protein L6
MSRIGNKPIAVPQGIKVQCQPTAVLVEGPKGKISHNILAPITVSSANNQITVKRPSNSIQDKVKHGTMRSVIQNMIKGASEGFAKKLLIEGVGFKAAVTGKTLTLNLGFTHPVVVEIPEGIKVTAKTPTDIDIEGVNRQQVGHFAAVVRAYYEPEPYKGKGVRYSNETVRRKAGKSVTK